MNSKRNAATDTAALIIPAVGNNKLRHEALQRFMLANDSTTLAVEVPIWISPEAIRELEREYGVALMPEGAAGALTGHIDFLQVRNRAGNGPMILSAALATWSATTSSSLDNPLGVNSIYQVR